MSIEQIKQLKEEKERNIANYINNQIADLSKQTQLSDFSINVYSSPIKVIGDKTITTVFYTKILANI